MDCTNKYGYIFFFILLFSACEKPVETGKLDLQAWKQDKGGCIGLRIKQMEAFNEVKENFMGLSETKMKGMLGFPDRHELSSRGRKSYIYFLHGGDQCPTEANHLAVMIEFSALDAVNLISIRTIE